MDNFIFGFLAGGAVMALILISVGIVDDDPVTVKTVKPLEPAGVYIKVNPGGVNDTVYVYEVKPD